MPQRNPYMIERLRTLVIFWQIVSHIPKTCSSSSSSPCLLRRTVLTCHDVASLDVEKLIKEISYKLNVDLIILESSQSKCSCKISKLARGLVESDVVVISSASCQWSEFKNCVKGLVIERPVVINGLVLSRNDSRFHWAVRHHCHSIWQSMKMLPQAMLRARIYKGILKELEDVITNKKTNANGTSTQDYHKVLEVASKTETEIEKNVKSNSSYTSEYAQEVKDDLEAIRKLSNDVAPSVNDKADMERQNLKFFTESELTLNLDKDLDLIKKLMDKKGSKKPKRYVKRNALKFTALKPLHIFPYRFFGGGEFLNLYDTFTVHTIISREQAMKVIQDKGIDAEIQESLEEERKYDDMKFDILTGIIKPEITNGPPTKDSNYKETETGRAGGEGPNVQTRGKKKTSFIIAPVVADAVVANNKTKTNTTKLTPAKAKKLAKSTEESDHRIKSLVVFFVAMIGIISVIAVLIIMTAKGNDSPVPGMYLDKKHRKRHMRNTERRLEENTKLIHSYEGATPRQNYVQGSMFQVKSGDKKSNLFEQNFAVENRRSSRASWVKLKGIAKISQRSFDGKTDDKPPFEKESDQPKSPIFGKVPPRSRPVIGLPQETREKNARLGGQHVIIDFRQIEDEEKIDNSDERSPKYSPGFTDPPTREKTYPSRERTYPSREGSEGSTRQNKRNRNKKKTSSGSKSSNSISDFTMNSNVMPTESDTSYDDIQEANNPTLVSFLQSIDNERDGILRYDHRIGNAWS